MDNTASTVGGIAIVFNAIPELQAMLNSALVGKPKTRALYVNRQGLALASTDPAAPSGSTIALPAAQIQPSLQVASWRQPRRHRRTPAAILHFGCQCFAGLP